MKVTRDTLLRWLEAYAEDVAANRDYLTQLDGAIGDNDHGINMERGFRAVVAALPEERAKPIDAILKDVGMTLIRTVGGASGPLYGTVFLRMAQAAAGKESLSDSDVGAMLAAGEKGIVDRGKAEVGDKTMLDTWAPAVRAYEQAVSDGKDLAEALRASAQAAKEGMESTLPLVARKGRASYLGERSAGHQDPGATSSYFLFRDFETAVTDTAE
jgi:dihydroxyacetone kinase-like protein